MNPGIKHWHRHRVWVIGASSGIGAETARLLLERGAKVALSARNRDGLQAIASNDNCALILPLDITRHEDLIAARDRILERWGGIDLVLVVAGTYNKMRADDFDLAVANNIVDTNLRGTLNCLDAVLPLLIEQGRGGIGIVASVAGLSGLPQALIYGPTKAALINLCESLYLDLRPRGIGVYTLCLSGQCIEAFTYILAAQFTK
jgi:NAD(P)-dependent dehydrogenase (short-subunit alcohol dehydrogenase family)